MRLRRGLEVVTKVTIARGVAGAYLLLRYHKEMQENYRKGDWAEAAKDTAFFAVAIAPVVAPTFFFGTLAPYWIGIGAGVVATGIIVEATGIGEWEDVRDFVLQDPRDMPRDYYETVVPAIQSEVTEPIIEYVTEELWQKQLVDPITGWVDRRERDLRRAWEITRPRKPTWL